MIVDNAGQAATMRALAIASSNGANVKVITIPDGKDPDEFFTPIMVAKKFLCIN